MFLSISKTLAQQIVDTIHDVCQYHINFITTDGMIYASSDPSRIGTFHEIGKQVASTGKTIEVDSDNAYSGTHKGINIPSPCKAKDLTRISIFLIASIPFISIHPIFFGLSLLRSTLAIISSISPCWNKIFKDF